MFHLSIFVIENEAQSRTNDISRGAETPELGSPHQTSEIVS
jgi:hypothetical protein